MLFVVQELKELIQAERVRAAVVGVYQDGEFNVHSVGQISVDDERVPTGETVFEIGSISKVFTALLVQVFVEEGLLDWDEPIQSYLPNVDFTSELVAAITPRQLATHRSGLPRLPTNLNVAENPMDPYIDYGSQDLVNFLESFNPSQLANEYLYSNLGFAILCLLTTSTGEKYFHELLDEKIFKPLGMNDSFIGMNASIRNFIATSKNMEIASGFSNSMTINHWNFNIHSGAGGILSTANDFEKFIEAHWAEPVSNIHQALAATREFQYDSPQGLGWNSMPSRTGTTVMWHNGQTGGFASFLAVDPQEQRGWVILTSSTESELITKLGMSFYADVEFATEIDTSRYHGVFQLAEGVYITFSNTDGQLQAQVSGGTPFGLEFVATHEFALPVVQISAKFELGEKKADDKLVWQERGQTIAAARVDDRFGIPTRVAIEVEEEELIQYIGKYKTEDANPLEFTVSRNIEQLFVQLSGQPAVPVYPMGLHRFFYKVVDAEIVFNVDDQDTITGLTLTQGQTVLKALRNQH